MSISVNNDIFSLMTFKQEIEKAECFWLSAYICKIDIYISTFNECLFLKWNSKDRYAYKKEENYLIWCVFIL